MGRSFVRVILGILLVLILLAGAGGAFVWWKISTLKQVLVTDLGKAVGASVQVTALDLDVWKGELNATGISLVNQRPSAPWDKGDISQVSLHFHLSDIFSPTMPVTIEVSSWNVILHSPLRTAEAPPADTTSPPDMPPSPGRIQVTHISAQQGTAEIDFADDRKVTVQGVSFEADNNGAGVWTTHVQASSIIAGSLQADASSIQILGDKDKITFTDLHLQCQQGVVTGNGNVVLGENHLAQVDLKAVDLPVAMLVSVEWQMKLSGLASGDLHYEGSDQGGSAKGNLVISHGKFNVLPWLGKVTTMVGLQDISDVEVDKATSDFEWKDNTFHLTNIDVRKNDVTRIGGTVDIDAQDHVDGKLKLGLPSSVTSKWPQLQTQVFPTKIDDYNWADVHLIGTPDHLQEDLTSRLLAAGLGQGSDLLNQATQKATDLFNSFMGNKPAPAPQTPPPPAPSAPPQ